MRPPIVTLTSDFGRGVFVGLMKGAVLEVCPWAALVDLDHGVPPQDVRSGALVLEQALEVFQPGSVHLAVVDPGVGTDRRPICVGALGMHFVGPDNGIFTPVYLADPQAEVRLLADPGYFRPTVSATFHGRDIFAPVAGHLAAGAAPEGMGPAVSDPVKLNWPRPMRESGALAGVVLAADRFGNLGTNLGRGLVESFLGGRKAVITCGDLVISGLSRAYGQAGPGKPLALFDSMGRLELAMNQGNLCLHLGLEPGMVFGTRVCVRAAPS